jgi:UDP-2,3-diacylglucosamine pyrophosphatase LpxH
MKKREIEVLVLSDLHLGTYGCHAKELYSYLKSIKPKTVVLNGDIIDVWQFSKRYFPKYHMKVIKQFFTWASKGITIHYICGNHDEMFRKFEGLSLGTVSIKNKLVLKLNGKKAWFFHGDVFDVTMKHSKWLARCGAYGYDFLILINRFVNFLAKVMGKKPLSFSQRIKNSVKGAVSFVNNFEQLTIDLAAEKNYDYVICGHIHKPVIKEQTINERKITYLNSGDWIENLTALEYSNGSWEIYNYRDEFLSDIEDNDLVDKSSNELFDIMFNDFIPKQ